MLHPLPSPASPDPAAPGGVHRSSPAIAAEMLRRLRARRRRGTVGRAVALFAVYSLAFLCWVRLGATPLDAAYAAMQAFTLGYDLPPDPAVLARGGPWVELMRIVRIAAPLVLVESAAFVAVLAGVIARPRWLLSDHVVIVGGGTFGRTLVEAMLTHERFHTEILVIDRDADALSELRELGCWVVQGDGTNSAVLSEARVDRARAVLAVTASDVSNVAVMWASHHLVHRRKGPHVYTHIEDPSLRETLRRFSCGSGATVFSLYEEAAGTLVAEASLAPGDLAVIVGYGRLGQALHRALPGCAALLVDRNPVVPSLRCCPAEPLQGDIRDESTVGALAGFITSREVGRREAARTVIFVATDQDVRNLDLAIHLRARLHKAGARFSLVTRVARHPPADAPELQGIGMRTVAEMVADHYAGLATVPRQDRWPARLQARLLRLVNWLGPR